MGPDGGRSPEDPDLRRGMGRGGERGLTQDLGAGLPQTHGRWGRGGSHLDPRTRELKVRSRPGTPEPGGTGVGLKRPHPGWAAAGKLWGCGEPGLTAGPSRKGGLCSPALELPSGSMPQLADRLKAECTVA